MTALTAAALYDLARKAGFAPDTAVTAAAIALAESGGRPNAIGDINNPVPGASSVGLWQINYQPAWNKVTYRDPTANLDPLHNAQSAFAISNGGTNFKPWTTFTKGIYLRFIPTVQAAIAHKPPVPPPPLPGGITPERAHQIAALWIQLVALAKI